ncbi:hypothetical protein AQUCO_06900032v1 [Aquilegia coerulea]|uniref:Uncharacterized protein n=1 Tax=Aquilegia coerulea TaxID=218851 RepID=A0A2G5CB47_AQUCA|nr:hypothetical protein AQUCO_06900032v1 [Aquilegia coerulea]PIA28474.1 hypothetical protein AQUCO_06900032v1 [Aquilegia coerulea]
MSLYFRQSLQYGSNRFFSLTLQENGTHRGWKMKRVFCKCRSLFFTGWYGLSSFRFHFWALLLSRGTFFHTEICPPFFTLRSVRVQ